MSIEGTSVSEEIEESVDTAATEDAFSEAVDTATSDAANEATSAAFDDAATDAATSAATDAATQAAMDDATAATETTDKSPTADSPQEAANDAFADSKGLVNVGDITGDGLNDYADAYQGLVVSAGKDGILGNADDMASKYQDLSATEKDKLKENLTKDPAALAEIKAKGDDTKDKAIDDIMKAKSPEDDLLEQMRKLIAAQENQAKPSSGSGGGQKSGGGSGGGEKSGGGSGGGEKPAGGAQPPAGGAGQPCGQGNKVDVDANCDGKKDFSVDKTTGKMTDNNGQEIGQMDPAKAQKLSDTDGNGVVSLQEASAEGVQVSDFKFDPAHQGFLQQLDQAGGALPAAGATAGATGAAGASQLSGDPMAMFNQMFAA